MAQSMHIGMKGNSEPVSELLTVSSSIITYLSQITIKTYVLPEQAPVQIGTVLHVFLEYPSLAATLRKQ